MNLDRVPAGKDVPNDCNVMIEIPMHADPIKYEVDKDTGAIFVDRFMSTAMHYPCNYGYIPHTLSDDGDPCDVLVLSPVPLITGVVVRCRPIGMLKMDDEAGGDAKILAVPIDKLSSLYRDVQSPRDLPEITTQQIAHFFEHYKDLEPGKWVRVATWVGAEEAKREIIDGIARYQASSPKPQLLTSRCARRAGTHARSASSRSRRSSCCCGAPASSPRSTACRTRRRSPFSLYRFVLVAALMGVVAVATRRGLAAHAARDRARRRSSAWLVHGLYLGGVLSAIAGGMSAGTAAMLVGLQPILTVLLARGWLGERVVAAAMGWDWRWGSPASGLSFGTRWN